MEKDIIKHDSGYGLIKRNIMRDQTISIQAKAIYSYLISFAGNSMTAFPSQKLMSEELGISDKTLKKYLNELKECGLVTVTQKRNNQGTFNRNIYTLTDQTEGETLPQGKNDRTEEDPNTVGNNLPSPEGNIYPINNNSINNNTKSTEPKTENKKENLEVENNIYNEELKDLIYEFIESRKKLKKPFTDTALKRMIKKLKEIGSTESEQIEIIENSIINGWAGIFPLDRRKPKAAGQDYFDEVDNWAEGGIDYGQAALRGID